MDVLVWKPQFEVGIKKIDHQHKQLLNCLNKCLLSVASIDQVFSDLKKYSEIHFSDEEILMAATEYPAIERHKKEHSFYEERMQQLEESVLKRESQAISLMVSFIRDWFLEHILKEDLEFSRYLKTSIKDEELKSLFGLEV